MIHYLLLMELLLCVQFDYISNKVKLIKSGGYEYEEDRKLTTNKEGVC